MSDNVTPTVDVSVLTPVLNEARHIRDVVACMQSQDYDGAIEFLFMDGRSTDDTRAIVEELSKADHRIRVLDNPARDTPSGLNVGLRAARGRYIVRMDGHTLYPPHYVSEGVARLERGDVAWVTGPQIPHGVGPWSERVATALGTWLGHGASSKWLTKGEADSVVNEIELDSGVFTGLWARDVLDELGGWDEGWPINQDSELAARVRQRGGVIVLLPQLGAHYVPRDSLKALARQYVRYGYYRAKTTQRHPETLRPSMLLNPAVAGSFLGLAFPVRQFRRLSAAAVAPYCIAVVCTSLRVSRGDPVEAAKQAAVFAVMHVTWGTGYLAGTLRFGPPTRRRGTSESSPAA